MKYHYRHISHDEAHDEPECDWLFGPSYHNRQLHLAAARASAQAAEPTDNMLISKPGEKRTARLRWHESSKLRGKRVVADLELVDSVYRDLIGDACLALPAVVKQVMNGYARLRWGVTEAWITVEALTLHEEVNA